MVLWDIPSLDSYVWGAVFALGLSSQFHSSWGTSTMFNPQCEANPKFCLRWRVNGSQSCPGGHAGPQVLYPVCCEHSLCCSCVLCSNITFNSLSERRYLSTEAPKTQQLHTKAQLRLGLPTCNPILEIQNAICFIFICLKGLADRIQYSKAVVSSFSGEPSG